MADISVTPKKGGNLTWLFALLAIVCTVGLMIWLAMQEGSTSPPPVVEEDSAAAVAPVDTTVADTTLADSTVN